MIKTSLYIDYLITEGFAALQKCDFTSAELFLTQAQRHAPLLPDALCGLAQLHQYTGNIGQAIEFYVKALNIDPDYYQCLLGLGTAHQTLNQFDKAEDNYLQALLIKPDYVPALNNLGVLLRVLGRPSEALEKFRLAIKINPDYADAHFNLSLALLQLANYRDGWREYEWRFRKSAPVPLRHTDIPRWDGQTIYGRQILIHAEQGYGDSIQFIRYAVFLTQLGASVTVEAQDEIIAPLLELVDGVGNVVVRGDFISGMDFQIPMMSLPMTVFSDPNSLPVFKPYITIPRADKESWQNLLCGNGEKIRVGIAWAGRKDYENDQNRSMPVEQLERLLNYKGVNWYSLQVGDRNICHPGLLDRTYAIHDFRDTAAFICTLDLIISVDTAVAHLAGAIGKPIWLMLPYSSDWRWLLRRKDSPWYPTMRIFQQKQAGCWEPTIDEILKDLTQR